MESPNGNTKSHSFKVSAALPTIDPHHATFIEGIEHKVESIIAKNVRVYLWVDINGLKIVDAHKKTVQWSAPLNTIVQWAVRDDYFWCRMIYKRGEQRERGFLTGYSKAVKLKAAMETFVNIHLKDPELASKLQLKSEDPPMGGHVSEGMIGTAELLESGQFRDPSLPLQYVKKRNKDGHIEIASTNKDTEAPEEQLPENLPPPWQMIQETQDPNMMAELVALREQNQLLLSQNQEYQGELDRLSQQLSMQAKGKGVSSELGAPESAEEASAMLDSLSQENARLEEQCKDLKTQLTLVESSRAAAPGMDYWKAEKETLMAMMEEKDNMVSALRNEVGTLKREVEEAKEAAGAIESGGQEQFVKAVEELAALRLEGTEREAEAQVLRTQLAEVQAELAGQQGQGASLAAELAASQTRVAELEGQLVKASQVAGEVAARQLASMRALQAGVQELRKQQGTLRTEALGMTSALGPMVETVFEGVTDFLHSHNIGPLEEMRNLYLEEVKRRKKLHNTLVDLKGNIRVYCRARPLLGKEAEAEAGQPPALRYPLGNEKVQVRSQGREEKTFQYERVFKSSEDQQTVFLEIEPLVTSVMDGYNVTIFAYGQTGSGKTYTMVGPTSDPGVNIRALQELFTLSTQREECQVEIQASMLEIYNENIVDLLNGGGKNSPNLEVRQCAVEGLKRVPVTSMEDVERVLALGNKSRSTFSTNMNEHSSRSHCMFTVYTTSTNTVTEQVTKGKLHLVDLAGSERLSRTDASGDRLKEAQAINKSLSSLGDVIAALAKKDKHVPFRNSKLTQVLQDSLEGTAKVAMFVNVSPTTESANETVCSLNFAARVRGVELGAAAQYVAKSAK